MTRKLNYQEDHGSTRRPMPKVQPLNCPVCGAETTAFDGGCACSSSQHWSFGSFEQPTKSEHFERLGFNFRTGRWAEKAWRDGWGA